MIQDTISKIRVRIEGSTSIREERRQELLQLLGKLESEVSTLANTHEEQARSIAGFAEVSTREATGEMPDPNALKQSLQGFSASAEEFEKSHPKLVHIVNDISRTLSNLGI